MPAQVTLSEVGEGSGVGVGCRLVIDGRQVGTDKPFPDTVPAVGGNE